MTKTAFKVEENNPSNRTGSDRYHVINAELEGKPDMYEWVTYALDDGSRDMAIYRDRETRSNVVIESDGGKSTLLTLIGDEPTLKSTLERIESIVPKIFTFKQIGTKN